MKLLRSNVFRIIAKKMSSLSARKERDQLLISLKEQTEEIVGLRDAVVRLEERNDEWAKEVRSLRRDDEPLRIIWPVAKDDLVKATLVGASKHKTSKQERAAKSQLVISWVIPPMGAVSGGHTTILRLIRGLEERGHICRIYIYDPQGTSSLDTIKEHLKTYPQVAAEVLYNQTIDQECDILFATSWHTAYPVYNSDLIAQKYYLVQDFEPFFDPKGTYSTLAENTYKFNLHGITLGSWMKDKLSSEYGMKCDNFDLAVTGDEYNLTNTHKRKKIVFYARPVTPRRGFELGILTLELFHKQYPDYEIHLVGWDVSRYEIPFEYVNHGIIGTKELNDLYNECAAGLVLSFTNMSLLPLEMMASGCIPVVNRASHTLKVGYSEYLTYANPTPRELLEGLVAAIEKAENREFINRMSISTEQFSWKDLNDSLERILKK